MIILSIAAFMAGILSFTSPCTLPILPAYMAYTLKSAQKNVIGMSISFFIGFSLIFSLLGMSATTIGGFLRSNLPVFSQVAGAIILIFGIGILSGWEFSGLKVNPKRPATYTGSFFFGTLLSVSWTACVGPILATILVMASTVKSAYQGGILLFIYGLGLALPLMLLSTYLQKSKSSFIYKIMKGKAYELKIGNKTIFIHTNNLISGFLFIALGILILSGELTAINNIGANFAPIQKLQDWSMDIERWILSFSK
ncbi:MAG: cytochrome c biogenesis protein CcdA [Epsilonproteobacteria bacterium]|nr:cytochrome c biogenesis protein CcdA [Campylobacterota bacterium]